MSQCSEGATKGPRVSKSCSNLSQRNYYSDSTGIPLAKKRVITVVTYCSIIITALALILQHKALLLNSCIIQNLQLHDCVDVAKDSWSRWSITVTVCWGNEGSIYQLR